MKKISILLILFLSGCRSDLKTLCVNDDIDLVEQTKCITDNTIDFVVQIIQAVGGSVAGFLLVLGLVLFSVSSKLEDDGGKLLKKAKNLIISAIFLGLVVLLTPTLIDLF